MAALNEELTWANVGAISTGPGTNVSDAFQLLFGNPTKELLVKGTKLYKFNGYRTLARDALTPDTPMSPWWSPIHAYKHDAGLEQKIKIAQANSVSLREWGRLTSAIKENWSSLDWLLTVELAEPVYAWFGGFKSMDRIDKDAQSARNSAVEKRGGSSKLPGGATQFYIPNLAFRHFANHAFAAL
ncbi:hypothetical protein [Sphingomonas sp.]|jgi:hypothetical protein|uniref:hypothetical protein n=1 Tax=Sphingomonas sp. TaxID=28214 RepID=UPI002EDB02DD